MNYFISLIIPTVGRCKELEKLFISISQSSYRNFEVIVVDQNLDNLIHDLCEKYENRFPLLHKKVNFKGAAKARNYGFQFAKGEIVNFPDDDCEITVSLLSFANQIFLKNSQIDAVFGRTIDPKTNLTSATKFIDYNTKVSISNLYHTTIECTMFMRKSSFERLGGFDVNLGVGTFFGAEEGADLVLRSLYQKMNLYYEPRLVFYHPSVKGVYDTKEFLRAYNYGKGFGRLSIKHLIKYKKVFIIFLFLYFQVKALVAIFIGIFSANLNMSKFYYNLFCGRMVGIFYTIKQELRSK